MAPRLSQSGNNFDSAAGQDAEPLIPGSVAEECGRSSRTRMSLCRKLMLTAQMWTMEASADFEQLYSVPILQTLGVPLVMISMTGFIAGPSGMIILPLIGGLTDRGSNPLRRKAAALVYASGVLFLGFALLLVANVMHLTLLLDYQARNDSSSNSGASVPWNVSSVVAAGWQNVSSNSSWVVLSLSDPRNEVGLASTTSAGSFVSTTSDLMDYSVLSPTLVPPIDTDTLIDSTTPTMPLKAVLGFVAIILLDLGFDGINSFTKAFVLTCSPRDQHTSILVLGLVMASAGGVSTAALGVVDFTSLLGLEYIEGGNLMIQTSVQAIYVMAVVTLGLLSSLLAGRSQLRDDEEEHDPIQSEVKTQHFQHESGSSSPSIQSGYNTPSYIQSGFTTPGNLSGYSTPKNQSGYNTPKNQSGYNTPKNQSGYNTPKNQATGSLQRASGPERFESSVHSFSGGGVSFDDTFLALAAEAARRERALSASASASASVMDHTPLLAEHSAFLSSSEVLTHPFAVSASYGAAGADSRRSGPPVAVGGGSTLADVPEGSVLKTLQEDAGRERWATNRSFKIKMVCICLATYFSIGQFMMFSFTASDFVGKAIFAGDPAGAPGSQSIARYQEGVRMASQGFLVLYISYMVISLFHHKLLARLGSRGEFVLSQLLLGMCMLLLGLTARMEAFYLTAVMAGFNRATFFVVPYAVTNDVMAAQTGDGKSKVGLAMSMVSATIPLSYCTLYGMVGPLEDLTGMVSVPLYVGALCGCLSALFFLGLGKV